MKSFFIDHAFVNFLTHHRINNGRDLRTYTNINTIGYRRQLLVALTVTKLEIV